MYVTSWLHVEIKCWDNIMEVSLLAKEQTNLYCYNLHSGVDLNIIEVG